MRLGDSVLQLFYKKSYIHTNFKREKAEAVCFLISVASSNSLSYFFMHWTSQAMSKKTADNSFFI